MDSKQDLTVKWFAGRDDWEQDLNATGLLPGDTKWAN
jgi:hypothetical protein